MKVGDKVIVDPRLHGCIWCIPVEEVKGKIMTIISINNPRGFEALRLIVVLKNQDIFLSWICLFLQKVLYF
jgi:hypothetical protein